MRAGLFWGLATFATGDIVYRVIHHFLPVAEAAPEVLAKLLTGPLDVVLFNFVLVGFLEELVFRRNLFRPMRNWLERRGLSPRAVFWTAALASSLIFSYVHYIDFGALLASWGIGGTVPGGGGAYVWSWATFSARAAAGAVLAYQYWRSGMLLVPIVAHFASNTMEGLGYRWGVEAFLLMAAGAVLLSLLGRRAPKPA
jgi:membrane protease YdiL (CAAX protease family)